MSKKICYAEIDNDGNDIIVCLSREEVLEQYFPYWSSMMQQVGRESEIDEERCIEDFMTIHWAWYQK